MPTLEEIKKMYAGRPLPGPTDPIWTTVPTAPINVTMPVATPAPIAGTVPTKTIAPPAPKILAPGTGTLTGGGGTAGGTVATDIPAGTPNPAFAYDPATDPLYQAAAAEQNRQIGNAMNRRGIYGSTIMQQNLSSAQANLIDSYKNTAYQKYNQELDDRQTAMDRAYANASKRGYYNNDEAALWGVKPGTRISKASSGGGGGADKNYPTGAVSTDSDGNYFDKYGDLVYTTTQKATASTFKSMYNSTSQDPLLVIGWLMERNDLTDLQKATIISNMGLRDGMGPEYWLQQWANGASSQTLPTNTSAVNPAWQQIINQENRWGY